MDSLKLKDLLEGLDFKNTLDLEEDLEIVSVEDNSQSVKKGSIFVAIKGYITDGHKYIQDAKDRGAHLAIVQEKSPVDLPQLVVEDSRIALAQLAAKFYDYPSKKMTMIGITATNGKTSTAFMLEEILKKAGHVVGMIGTVRLSYPGVSLASILTTPGSLDLQYHLAQMVKAGVEYVIMEVSSSALELHRVYGIDFDIVTFNNLSHEHIDQHGSYEKYVQFKSRLITQAKEEGASILNQDVPEINSLKDQTASQVFSYSFKDPADIVLGQVDLSTGLAAFNYQVPKEIKRGDWTLPKTDLAVQLKVAGYHSLMNAFVAITAALLLKIDPEDILMGLEDFSGVERRFEMIYDEDFKILDDHFANVKNIQVTLQTLEKMVYKDLHILYAIRGGRGLQVNRENSEEIAKWLKKLKPAHFMACLSQGTVGPKDQVQAEERAIFEEVMEESGFEVPIEEELKPAIISTLEKADKGDIVLLAGCQGMDLGAKIAWEYLIGQDLVEDKEKYIDKIKNRIC
ncbi:MAG: UDP-N-acetylmuramyl-tripeptide synthetase [Tissierellia bacterium]|nr:UDP-N-acetylmuramyl-tripeptide synthetase [Tissierellia bacterium]